MVIFALKSNDQKNLHINAIQVMRQKHVKYILIFVSKCFYLLFGECMTMQQAAALTVH